MRSKGPSSIPGRGMDIVLRVRDKWRPTEITHMGIKTPYVSLPVILILLRIQYFQYEEKESHRVLVRDIKYLSGLPYKPALIATW